MWKLISVVKSPQKDKKWRANFYDKENDKKKHTDFGASGYTDFLLSGNLEKRELYRERHKKDLKTGDPTRAGFLSYYLLWNKPTLVASVMDYKNKFNM
jgi:hypothetical protein